MGEAKNRKHEIEALKASGVRKLALNPSYDDYDNAATIIKKVAKFDWKYHEGVSSYEIIEWAGVDVRSKSYGDFKKVVLNTTINGDPTKAFRVKNAIISLLELFSAEHMTCSLPIDPNRNGTPTTIKEFDYAINRYFRVLNYGQECHDNHFMAA